MARQYKCRSFFNKIPDFAPEIYSLSTYLSVNGEYTTVTVTGKNFLINNTYILFGNTKVAVSFLSSGSISFIVPTIYNLDPGYQNYNIKAVTQITVNPQYQAVTLYSNAVNYELYQS